MDKKELINWAELPPDLTSAILSKLGAFDILENSQKVCKLWHRVCEDPLMWRKIDMYSPRCTYLRMSKDFWTMCRHAVDRSQGCLVEINIWFFCNAQLLNYIADRSRNLRILRFMMCSNYETLDNATFEAFVKLPLLEYFEVSNFDFEISNFELSGKYLRFVGQSCPNLRTLKLTSQNYNLTRCKIFDDHEDDDALAIAQTMPQLRHLQLFGDSLTNEGLKAILDGCPHLEHLDLRRCFSVDLTGDLEKRCIERIKDLKRPNDSGQPYLHGNLPLPCDDDDWADVFRDLQSL